MESTQHRTVSKAGHDAGHRLSGQYGVRRPKELSSASRWYDREDLRAWLGGMVFIATLLVTICVLGEARGWDAWSGYTHNDSMTSPLRFLPEPFVEDKNIRGRHGREAAARWYYWKLKPELTSVWTHLFPWTCYVAHQVFTWAVIYQAQLTKAMDTKHQHRFSTKMAGFNWWLFSGNIFFHLLHLLNTHVTYDATAPDVSIASSQSSVIMLIVMVILMDYKERGILFGWPNPKQHPNSPVLLSSDPSNLVRRYHGYAFAWAVIYTFWYHPMENTLGHALGFIYTWIIMLQGSLMYTDVHLNRYWRLLQEGFVVVHGGAVAWQTGGSEMLGTMLWPMFTFGLGLFFVLTSIFSLPFWPKIPSICRLLPLAVYSVVTLWAYSWIPDKEGRVWVRITEIFRIPTTYYIFFFMAYSFIKILLKIEKLCNGGVVKPMTHMRSPVQTAMWLAAAMFVYGIHMGLAMLVELGGYTYSLLLLTVGLVSIYTLGASISSILLKQVIPYRIIKD